MKKMIFTFLCLCVCLPMVAAVGPSVGNYDVLFVNNQTQEFEALVGRMAVRTGLVHFPDAEIPPDPNQPVAVLSASGVGNDFNDYWITLEGADKSQFRAMITSRSLTSNQCTVKVIYCPSAMGTHTATLWVNCSNAGVPVVKVPLVGESTGVLGDLNADGQITIFDVTNLIHSLLVGDNYSELGDINCDGKFSISDVTTLIHRVLTVE